MLIVLFGVGVEHLLAHVAILVEAVGFALHAVFSVHLLLEVVALGNSNGQGCVLGWQRVLAAVSHVAKVRDWVVSRVSVTEAWLVLLVLLTHIELLLARLLILVDVNELMSHCDFLILVSSCVIVIEILVDLAALGELPPVALRPSSCYLLHTQ